MEPLPITTPIGWSNRPEQDAFLLELANKLMARGYNVEVKTPYHFRVDGVLDFFPKNRRYHYLPTNTRGSYDDIFEAAEHLMKQHDARTEYEELVTDQRNGSLLSRPKPKFMECDTCRAKPGMPTLCEGCLHNRRVIDELNRKSPRKITRKEIEEMVGGSFELID